jgi:hypothetical protein
MHVSPGSEAGYLAGIATTDVESTGYPGVGDSLLGQQANDNNLFIGDLGKVVSFSLARGHQAPQLFISAPSR